MAAPEAQEPGNWGEGAKEKALDDRRRLRESNDIAEVSCHERQLQQVGNPPNVGLAVLGQAEKVEHQYLKAGGGADVDPHAGFLLAGIPPLVRHASRRVDLATGLGNPLLASKPEADASAQDREAFLHGWMPMFANYRPGGSDVEVTTPRAPAVSGEPMRITTRRNWVFKHVASRGHLA